MQTNKTAKVLGLFMAVALAATAGCGTTDRDQLRHVHYDKNGDGYCDEDGQPMDSSYGGSHYYHSGGYYSLPHYGSSTPASSPGHPAGISSGTAAHGGIGSVSAGGGG